MSDPISFIHTLSWEEIPEAVKSQAALNLLDLIGVAIAGSQTKLSRIIRDFAASDMPGALPLVLDGRGCSASGHALALGMTIDSVDGHDGYNPAKGHIGCPMMPAILALGQEADVTGQAFLEALVLGYEFGARVSVAQHATVADYHTSGSWGAVAAAAAGARLLGLDAKATRHALGIAEYHGPRSQMMRCIDHPTMLKDGAGWGAMCGVSAVKLAQAGFTGAPALTVETAPEYWHDLAAKWATLEQYYKPYPVCRWAQAPVEGVLALRAKHHLTRADVAHIEVETFHEAVRLAVATPQTTEEAQYSTSFPCAVALVRGAMTPEDIDGPVLQDPEILRLSESLVMREDAEANAAFPNVRRARVTLVLHNGARLTGDWVEPKWDASAPPSPAELEAKFDAFADPLYGKSQAEHLKSTILTLAERPLFELCRLLVRPGR